MSRFHLPDDSRIKTLFDLSDDLSERSDAIINEMTDTTKIIRIAEQRSDEFSNPPKPEDSTPQD